MFDFLLLINGILIFAFSFLITFIAMPRLIKAMKARGITGKDLNKYNKPEIPELGGIGVWLGFSFGVMFSIFLVSYTNFLSVDLTVLLAGFSTIIMVGFFGVIDDIIGWKNGLKQWQHALLPLFAALPLMAINIANPPIRIPFLGFVPAEYTIPIFGTVSFGILYSLILVPIGITGASNATNMLAGLNGLEAGLGSLIMFTLSLITLILGRPEAFILSIAILASLLAFIKFNWFPARIFGGDSLTLMTGASIAAVSIIGDLEKIGIMLMALYFIEFVFKAKHKFKSECYGIPQKDGTLMANPKGGSLTHLIMRARKLTEPKLVLTILSMQAILCLIVFIMFNFKLILL